MIELLAAFANALGICISKFPNWDQKRKDDYFAKLSQYQELLARDKRFVDEEELLKCQDDLRSFVTVYAEDLKK